MRKAFQYRLYPSRKQARLLQETLNECRWLYNRLLEERKNRYEETRAPLSLYERHERLPDLKAERPSLSSVHSQVLQNVAVRIDLAFKAFFRRVKAGEKPGYPRFRGFHRYDSFCFPQSGYGFKDGKLYLSKLGHFRIKLHRPIEGVIKTCGIRRTATGKWFAGISVETEATPLSPSDEAVGIDVGLESFATFSDGSQVENPRFFRREEKALAKVQRRLSKAEKGSKDRAKQRRRVAKVHERIANLHRDFIHQQSRKVVNRYQTICVEDLRVNRMVHNHCLSKSIHDAAWSGFFVCLTYKAEDAGRTMTAVNPAYTSQDCSRCGHRKKKLLSERWRSCDCGGLELHRDHNAALNILRIGLDSVGIQSVEAPGL